MGDDVNIPETDFENVTIQIRVSDLMRIERLIDEAIQASVERGEPLAPHDNPLIMELMKMYHRVMPDEMKDGFEERSF